MLNEHQKNVREQLEKLKELQRNILLGKANWRDEAPIYDAMQRVEQEEAALGDGEPNEKAPDVGFSVFDVSFDGVVQRTEQFVPKAAQWVQPKIEAPRPKPAERPRQEEKPKDHSNFDLSNTERQAEEKQLEAKKDQGESDNVSPPTPELPRHAPTVPEKPENWEKRKEAKNRQEDKRIARVVANENARRQQFGMPKMEKEEREEFEEQNRWSKERFTSLPHIFGGKMFNKLENEAPEVRETDGGTEPVDIAGQLEFASDVAETSFVMVTNALERIVSGMVKMQNDINVINEILDRSFGH